MAAIFENFIEENLGSLNKDMINAQNIEKYEFAEAWKIERAKYKPTFKLLRAIETLPYSSVSIEGTFSVATDIKTFKCNCLSVDSLPSCLLVKHNCQKDIPFSSS